jgi:hypothetical protein
MNQREIIFGNMLQHIATDYTEGNIKFGEEEGARFMLLRRAGMKTPEGENVHTLNFTVISNKEETDAWAQIIDTLNKGEWEHRFLKLGQKEDR